MRFHHQLMRFHKTAKLIIGALITVKVDGADTHADIYTGQLHYAYAARVTRNRTTELRLTKLALANRGYMCEIKCFSVEEFYFIHTIFKNLNKSLWRIEQVRTAKL